MSQVNQLPFIDVTNSETGCCPRFDPTPWDHQTFILDNMRFAKASTRSFLHMPLNLGKVFTKTQSLIDASKANHESGYLILSQDVSNWKAHHYFRVSKDVAGLKMTSLSGTFMTKVFDSDFKNFPKIINEFKDYIKSEGHIMKDFFIFYTTCPNCAKQYGHNYMVFFGRIS